MRRIGRFLKALFRWAVYGHFDTVPVSLYAARLRECGQCGYLDGKECCSVCGCVVRVKARWTTESCPEGRWNIADLEYNNKTKTQHSTKR